MKNRELTEEQKRYILENYDKKDIKYVIQEAFDDDTLDARKWQGKLVTSFLNDLSLKYKTSRDYDSKEDSIQLTFDQKEYIKNNISRAKNLVELASTVFRKDLTPLHAEFKVLKKYVDEEFPDLAGLSLDEVYDEYVPPTTFLRTLRKINECLKGQDPLKEDKLNNRLKVCIEKLMSYMHSPRFLSVASNYRLRREREIFELEFVKSTWDKPDLSSDDINLYINLCQEYIMQERILRVIDRLQEALDELAEGEGDAGSVVSISNLADSIKKQREDLDKSIKRQITIKDDLDGKRKERVKDKENRSKNIAHLVQLVQEEEIREDMLVLAERRRQEVKEAAVELDRASETEALILGLSRDEYFN